MIHTASEKYITIKRYDYYNEKAVPLNEWQGDKRKFLIISQERKRYSDPFVFLGREDIY